MLILNVSVSFNKFQDISKKHLLRKKNSTKIYINLMKISQSRNREKLISYLFLTRDTTKNETFCVLCQVNFFGRGDLKNQNIRENYENQKQSKKFQAYLLLNLLLGIDYLPLGFVCITLKSKKAKDQVFKIYYLVLDYFYIISNIPYFYECSVFIIDR